MQILKFLSDNWAQIVVVIGAIGYIIKTILDFQVKKKEIRFAYIYQEKSGAFHQFFLSYQDFISIVVTQSFRLKAGAITYQEFDSMVSEQRKAIMKNIDALYIYCSKKEIDLLYKVANSTASVAYKVKNKSEDELSAYLLEYQDTNRKAVNKLIRNL
jgi:hypothetical protein